MNQFFGHGQGDDVIPDDAGAPVLMALRALENGDGRGGDGALPGIRVAARQ